MRGRWAPVWRVLVMACIGGAASAAESACKMKLYSSVNLSFTQSGAVLIPVKLNDRDVWMYLQLSQGLPAISPAIVDELGLRRVSVGSLDMTVGGRPVLHQVKLPHLRIGGIDFTGWNMYVLPEDDEAKGTYAGLPVAGRLTSRFLRTVDAELNFAERKMNFFAQTRCNGGAVYWGSPYTRVRMNDDSTGLVMFTMELDGQKVEAGFNTTSWFSRISKAVTSKYFGFDSNSPGVMKEQTGTSGEMASYYAMSLTARNLSLNNARIRLDEARPQCSVSRGADAIGYSNCVNSTPFLIGTDLLRQLRIYIASKEEAIYFTRVPDAAPVVMPSAASAPAP